MSHYSPNSKWNEMAAGGIIPQPGNAVEYVTGGWRNQRPIKDNETCIDCFFCWVYCPDVSILRTEDGKVKGAAIDLDHCKGCGICATVCPKKCITMVSETEALLSD
ncbi:MAG: 4Fe-4S dicluster-binding protein [Armatimonadota bacterium]